MDPATHCSKKSGLATTPARGMDPEVLRIYQIKSRVLEEIDGVDLHVNDLLIREDGLFLCVLLKPGYLDSFSALPAAAELFHDPW